MDGQNYDSRDCTTIAALRGKNKAVATQGVPDIHFYSMHIRKSYANPITKLKPHPKPNTNPNCNNSTIKTHLTYFQQISPQHHPSGAMFTNTQHPSFTGHPPALALSDFQTRSIRPYLI